MKFLWSALVCLSLSACGLQKVASERKGLVNTPARVAASSGSEAHLPVGDVPAEAGTSPAPATAPTNSPKHRAERGPVSADKALGWLINGNKRFRTSNLRNDGQKKTDVQRLASGQKPHTIVLSCSDSRVPPEVLFDQKLGEIFVIRTAGETLDFGAIGSIEYALEHLGTNLILVMGHSSCGAVKAALSTLNGADAGSPALNKLVHDLHPHLRTFASTPVSEGAMLEGWANTEGVAKDLVQRSQIVRDALNTGEVKIQTALYNLNTGAVEFR